MFRIFSTAAALLCLTASVSALSCSDMKSLVAKYFPADDRDIMLCIAYHESSYNPKARNPSGATGLFQIMPSHCGEPGCPSQDGCVEKLMDPSQNAECALSVLKSQGFNAWTTYSMCRSGGGPCQDLEEHKYEPNPFGLPDFNYRSAVELIQNQVTGDMNRTRAEVMDCAKRWVSDEIPYCQCDGAQECCGSCPYCSTYRCDCSGYVTACYALHKPHNTQTLLDEFHRIEHHELKVGDIMLWPGSPPEGHVVMFGGWTDKDMTHYVAYQEPGCHEDGPHHAYASTVPYPMSWTPPDGGAFKPYRYNHIQD